MQAEEQRDSLNARGALMALIVPQLATVSEGDTRFALQELGFLNVEVPDLHVLFLAGGLHTRFERFVRDPSRDLFPLLATGSNADNVATQTLHVVQRIQSGMFGEKIVGPISLAYEDHFNILNWFLSKLFDPK